MNFLETLPKPFFVLAPMDDVTDTVFRQIIGSLAPPDLYITEFVNVDGLQSPGRKKLLKKLRFSAKERPIIAQLWGKNPENYYKTAREIADGTLLNEIVWHNRRSGLSKVQGSNEQRMSRTKGTSNGPHRQLTQQFVKNGSGVTGSAGEQSAVARAPGGFDGVDLNMGCPVRAVMSSGNCIALINNRELAQEIIQATREGESSLPLSVKTRLGLSEIDYSWHEFLLKQKLNILIIHGRTAKQLSKVPADWNAIEHIRQLRDNLSPATLIVGNGDVLNRQQGEQLAKQHNLDGIMIGRGVFHDPFVFAEDSPWEDYAKAQRIALYTKHVKLFAKTWQKGERPVHTLNKFCKIYINSFDGAKEMREELMAASSTKELLELLT